MSSVGCGQKTDSVRISTGTSFLGLKWVFHWQKDHIKINKSCSEQNFNKFHSLTIFVKMYKFVKTPSFIDFFNKKCWLLASCLHTRNEIHVCILNSCGYMKETVDWNANWKLKVTSDKT